jgi:hypothetical protein
MHDNIEVELAKLSRDREVASPPISSEQVKKTLRGLDGEVLTKHLLPTIFVTAGVCYFCCEKIPIKPVTVPNITDYMCDICKSFGKCQ